MGLGKHKAPNRDAVFVDLKFAANKGSEYVGFRQTIARTPRENAKEGERKYDYEYENHTFVEGELTGFRVKSEPRYDNPNETELMAYATVRDLGNPPEPDTIIRYPLLSQAGRRMTGLLAAAVAAKAGSVHIYANYAEAGTQLGDRVLDKPTGFLNCKVGDNKGPKLTPLYYGEDGAPLLDKDGKPEPLPKGEKHVIARKEVWDFTKADEIVASTAYALEESFKRDAQRQDATEHDDEVGEDDVDLAEAAGVAMRG